VLRAELLNSHATLLLLFECERGHATPPLKWVVPEILSTEW
jgi:hypothetical protein